MKMERYLVSAILAVSILLAGSTALHATGNDSSQPAVIPKPGIPIHDVSKEYRRMFHTQVSGTIGSAVVYPGDRPLRSYGVEVKGIHYFSGSLYLSGGAGFNARYSASRPGADGGPSVTHLSRVIILPAGIGMTMGDDQATFLTGIDLEPSLYFPVPGAAHDRQRVVGVGLAPEFGFLFKTGRPWQRGMQLGMIGKVHFMQTPDAADGFALRYGYFGVGLVARF